MGMVAAAMKLGCCSGGYLKLFGGSGRYASGSSGPSGCMTAWQLGSGCMAAAGTAWLHGSVAVAGQEVLDSSRAAELHDSSSR
jgi:hypothetical protein